MCVAFLHHILFDFVSGVDRKIAGIGNCAEDIVCCSINAATVQMSVTDSL